jgi:hypothetical protein
MRPTMSITVAFTAPNLITIHISGVILRTEVDASKHAVHDLMLLHGKCLAMMRLEPGFSGLQAFASWNDIDVDHSIKQHLIRLAVVGDVRWRDSALLFLFNSMVPFQIEYFPANQEEFGLAWLTH